MSFDKCTHKYSIQDHFTALKILCGPPIHPLSPSLWQILIFFTASIPLPFPACHIVVIIQHVAFSDWLFSLSSTYLGFLHIFLWRDSLFSKISELYSIV